MWKESQWLCIALLHQVSIKQLLTSFIMYHYVFLLPVNAEELWNHLKIYEALTFEQPHCFCLQEPSSRVSTCWVTGWFVWQSGSSAWCRWSLTAWCWWLPSPPHTEPQAILTPSLRLSLQQGCWWGYWPWPTCSQACMSACWPCSTLLPGAPSPSSACGGRWGPVVRSRGLWPSSRQSGPSCYSHWRPWSAAWPCGRF